MAYYDFKTEEEAEEKVKSLQGISIAFCPVINAECRADCICYVEARKSMYTNGYGEEKTDWRVFNPFCSHVLISGEITNWQQN